MVGENWDVCVVLAVLQHCVVLVSCSFLITAGERHCVHIVSKVQILVSSCEIRIFLALVGIHRSLHRKYEFSRRGYKFVLLGNFSLVGSRVKNMNFHGYLRNLYFSGALYSAYNLCLGYSIHCIVVMYFRSLDCSTCHCGCGIMGKLRTGQGLMNLFPLAGERLSLCTHWKWRMEMV